MCVCGCIITHDQSIKGKVMILQMRLQSQADAEDKEEGLLQFRISRLSSYKLQVKSPDLLEDLDL